MAGVATAVAAVSAAAIFIRLANAPSLAISFWRCAIAAAVIGPIAIFGRAPFPRGRALVDAMLAGVALAFHFALWIASLSYTSVAASVVLVCTQPVFVTVFAWVWLDEKTSRLAQAGIAVAFVGSVLIGLDAEGGSAALSGNLLATGGAIAVSVYVLLGRRVRAGGVGLLPYTATVYGTSALVLGATALVAGVPLHGFGANAWTFIVATALIPQLLGHTLFNWALGYVAAPVLSSTILAEPVVSSLLALVILDEVPGALTTAGGLVVLGGLALVQRGEAASG